MPLTVQSVRVAKPDPRGNRREIPDGADGLYLVIQGSGKKSWAVRYRNGQGQNRKFTLGPVLFERTGSIDGLPSIGAGHTLGEARKAAKAAMVTVGEGGDPAGERKALKSPATDGTVAAHIVRFLKAKSGKRTAGEMKRLLDNDALADLRGQHIRAVGKSDIVAACDKITDDGKLVLANRTFSLLRTFFKWLVGRGALDVSPCDGLALPNPDAEKPRDKALTDAELSAVWHASYKIGEPFGALVRLMILTGQRRGEVSGIFEDEVDRIAAVWTLKGDRTKNAKEHAVPLSPAALREIPDADDERDKKALLLSTTGTTSVSGWTKVKRRLDTESGVTGWVIHDLRRTAATNLQRLRFPIDVTEAVLNHASGSRGGIVDVYQTHDYADEKREALIALARFVTDIVTVDERRIAWDGMRAEDRGADRDAFRAAIRSGAATWSEYLAALDAPAQTAEAA